MDMSMRFLKKKNREGHQQEIGKKGKEKSTSKRLIKRDKRKT